MPGQAKISHRWTVACSGHHTSSKNPTCRVRRRVSRIPRRIKPPLRRGIRLHNFRLFRFVFLNVLVESILNRSRTCIWFFRSPLRIRSKTGRHLSVGRVLYVPRTPYNNTDDVSMLQMTYFPNISPPTTVNLI
jgi:hypothetical protein